MADTLVWSKIGTKRRVLNALLMRELMQRFGHGNIGFLWLIGEPLLLTAGVMIVWTVISGSQRHGVNVIPLVLTGYSLLTLWRNMVNRSIQCFRGSAELLFHRTIRPIDIFVARQLLEIFGCLIAFFVAYVPLVLLDVIEPVDDYLLLLGGWFLLSFFGFGFGLIVASLTELSETLERFVQPVMYLTIPLTGAFYMVSWLPRSLQEFVLLSPLVHASEMIRAGYFGPSVPTHWSVFYLLACGLAANAIGLAMVGKASKNIEM